MKIQGLATYVRFLGVKRDETSQDISSKVKGKLLCLARSTTKEDALGGPFWILEVIFTTCGCAP